VFGVESEKWGETPVAAVVLQADAELDAATLQEWINSRVEARFQKISDVVFVNQMPRNVAGKTLKNELKDNYLANQK
jgi:acyl-CoA synthetase (AMP-forming)/AMP-acid ligase II